MEPLTLIALILFALMVAAWVVLPGSASTEAAKLEADATMLPSTQPQA